MYGYSRYSVLKLINSNTPRNKSHIIISLRMKKTVCKQKVEKPLKEVTVTLPVSLDKTGSVRINVLAKPGAKVSAITGIEEDGVGVQVAAKPVDGEANCELIRYISSVLNLKKSEVTLDKGSKSRHKTLIITSPSLTVALVLEKLKEEAYN